MPKCATAARSQSVPLPRARRGPCMLCRTQAKAQPAAQASIPCVARTPRRGQKCTGAQKGPSSRGNRGRFSKPETALCSVWKLGPAPALSRSRPARTHGLGGQPVRLDRTRRDPTTSTGVSSGRIGLSLPPCTYTTPHRRLLPKSRLSAADEPPAEEAHEAAHDDDRGDGDARDRAGREAAPVRAGGRALGLILAHSEPGTALRARGLSSC